MTGHTLFLRSPIWLPVNERPFALQALYLLLEFQPERSLFQAGRSEAIVIGVLVGLGQYIGQRQSSGQPRDPGQPPGNYSQRRPRARVVCVLVPVCQVSWQFGASVSTQEWSGAQDKPGKCGEENPLLWSFSLPSFDRIS